jgi:hypothetical protein
VPRLFRDHALQVGNRRRFIRFDRPVREAKEVKMGVNETRHQRPTLKVDAIWRGVPPGKLGAAHRKDFAFLDHNRRADGKRRIDGQHSTVEQNHVRPFRGQDGKYRCQQHQSRTQDPHDYPGLIAVGQRELEVQNLSLLETNIARPALTQSMQA